MATYKFQKNEYVTYQYGGSKIRAQVIDHVKEPGTEVEQEDGTKRVAKENDPAYKLKIADQNSDSDGKKIVKLESNLNKSE